VALLVSFATFTRSRWRWFGPTRRVNTECRTNALI